MKLINEKFKYEQVLKDNRKTVVLSGVIDEDTLLDEMVKLGSPLVFNFAGIASINSCGVRNWVNFIKQIPNVPVTYEECPAVIVRQLNMVPSFIGHARVDSIYATYVCPECDSEFKKLVPRSQFGSIGSEISEKCTQCKKEGLELDGNPEQYIAFSK